MGLPNINISFSSAATTAVARSAKGIVCLLLKDTTSTESVTEYVSETQIKKEKWTEDNIRYIKEVLLSGCAKLYCVRLNEAGEFNESTQKITDSFKWNWICSPEVSVQSAIVSYVKAKNKASAHRKFKAMVYKAVTSDDDHIVNLTNETVTRKKGAAESGATYTPRLAGILAAMPFTRSATYFVLDDLEAVAEPEDADGQIDNGEFVIINDYGEPKIGSGVTSLKTEEPGKSKSICIVEAMDLMLEDIYETFKRTYVGKFKNKYYNQALFIAAVNKYFIDLAKEDVLDPEYTNIAEIDIEAQREAWIGAGKSEAAEWDDVTVKKNTFKKMIFLKGDVKVLDAVEGLNFGIALV